MSKIIFKLAAHFDKQLKKLATTGKLELIWNDEWELSNYLDTLPQTSPEYPVVEKRIKELKVAPKQSNKLTPEEERKVKEQLENL